MVVAFDPVWVGCRSRGLLGRIEVFPFVGSDGRTLEPERVLEQRARTGGGERPIEIKLRDGRIASLRGKEVRDNVRPELDGDDGDRTERDEEEQDAGNSPDAGGGQEAEATAAAGGPVGRQAEVVVVLVGVVVEVAEVVGVRAGAQERDLLGGRLVPKPELLECHRRLRMSSAVGVGLGVAANCLARLHAVISLIGCLE